MMMMMMIWRKKGIMGFAVGRGGIFIPLDM